MTRETIEKLIQGSLRELGYEGSFAVEYPLDMKNGDYSTNVALALSKSVGVSPRELAEKLAENLRRSGGEMFEKVEVAGPGFINFHLSKEFFREALQYINKKGKDFGKTKKLKGEKVIVEYTDPNPFKEFHIGHLMSNAIGESVSRIIEWSGARTKRANYQGDTGMHVAKAIWGYFRGEWKSAYQIGSKAYEENLDARLEIEEINKKIYDRSDKKINKVYDEGRKISLKYFDSIYKKLGTKFDYLFFESDAGKLGMKIVEENIGKVFEKSDGAVVYMGEKFDSSLHTRVFINKHGQPTYEAKDLGNAKQKYNKYKYTRSVVVTGNEIRDYFKVMLSALAQIYPKLSEMTKHLPHGMLRLPTGKMSSRTGDVITAESLIEDVKERVKGDEQVAIGAIKYMILRQSIGNDIIFDIEKSVSTEGDSGVYLQYAHARANSIMEKSRKRGNTKSVRAKTHEVERLLHRFPEIIERAQVEYAPHHITTYLTELAGSFNNFYAHEQVISDEPESAYRLAIVEAFKNIIKNGLVILGIPSPDKM
ncbi:MAG: arginine--tRNA ligase [Minisyncoccota bacterium]